MELSDSLLLNIRKYSPRPGRDPLEDFVTEVFCWLLRQSEEFTGFFLARINEQLPMDCISMPNGDVTWHTQFPLERKRLDMLGELPGVRLVFEHKVGDSLDEEQVKQYRELAKAKWKNCEIYVVGITGNSAQKTDAADVCLCWKNVYDWIGTYLDIEEGGPKNTYGIDEQERYHFRDFMQLLSHEGLGPGEPVDPQALRYYPVASSLPEQLYSLLGALGRSGDLKTPDGYEVNISGRMRWGRIGFVYERQAMGESSWSPGLFVGCVLDGSDHCVSHRVAQVVKLQIIVSFVRELHEAYPEMPAYNAMREHMASHADGAGWEFYDHLTEEPSPNRYHPLYLEVPLQEVLRGAESHDKQLEQLVDHVSRGLEIIASQGHLAALTQACDEVLRGKAG